MKRLLPILFFLCAFAAPLCATQRAITTDGTTAGVITGLFTGPQSFATIEVPDNVAIGWTQIGGVWQKSASLLAAEAAAADLAAKRTQLTNSVATLRQWADDAESTTATSGNAVAVLNTLLDRLAVFFDHFADMIESRRD
jgi:hypothetical protein